MIFARLHNSCKNKTETNGLNLRCFWAGSGLLLAQDRGLTPGGEPGPRPIHGSEENNNKKVLLNSQK
jgi:hypothetical protein